MGNPQLKALLPFFWISGAEPTPPADSPGSFSNIIGTRRGRNRVSAMSFILNDTNNITAITAASFQILRSDRTLRFTHTQFTLVGGPLPANRIGVSASGDLTVLRAAASNLLSVTVTYTDSVGGPYTITSDPVAWS